MQRREVLRFLGTAMLGPLLTGFSPEERLRVGRALHTRALVSKPGQVLNPDQMAQLRGFADTILPKTDTPGALDVGAPEFFDLLLAEWYPESERNEIIAGMNALEDKCRQSYGKPFAELDSSNRAAFLTTIDVPRATRGTPEDIFGRVKDGLIFGFVTSKPISELTRTTPIIPGRFDGCIPLRTPS
jgi:hypothetical protein